MFRLGANVKRIVAMLVAVLMVVLIFSAVLINYVSAATESQLKQQQQNLDSSKNEIKTEIEGLNSKKDDVMAEKKELDQQVSVLQGEIDEVNVEIDGYQQKIDQVTVELDAATAAAEEQYQAYKKRVRIMYENGTTGYLDILLSAESVGDFFSRMEIVKQITAYDSNMTDKLKAKQAEIQGKRDELTELQQGLLDTRSVLEGKKSDLNGKMAYRDKLIKEINSDVSKLEKELKKIEAEEASVRAQLANLSGKAVPYSGGKMTWPAPSCHWITSEYGWRLHPVLKYEKLHTGIDIGAGYGAKIVAAKSGTVVTSTYNGAYGNYVTINHGGGIATLYAHMSSAAVSAGAWVAEGEVIGYVGSTGYSTGPHLHFEVIVNGATTDPMGYLN